EDRPEGPAPALYIHLSGRAGVTGCAPVGDRIINPKGRPRAPRFTERDRQAVLAALAGAFDKPAQRKAAIKVFWTALTRPRTVLKALELAGRLAGELYGPWRRGRPYNNLAGRRWELVAVS